MTVREGKNVKGRFLGVVLGSVGKSKLENAFRNSVKAIESRNYAVAATDSRTLSTSAAS